MQKRSVNVRYYFLKEINPIIRFLIISDILIVGAAGMLSPIFAIFVEDFIKGGNTEVVGTAIAIYLITKSIFQIPIAAVIDKIRGYKYDFYFIISFSILLSLVPLLYLLTKEPWHLYLVQFLLGLFSAMVFPSFMAIFTRHIDKTKEGMEWGIYFTLTDLTSAALAAVGGYVAFSIGFPYLIVSLAVISTLGSLLLLLAKPYIKGAAPAK